MCEQERFQRWLDATHRAADTQPVSWLDVRDEERHKRWLDATVRAVDTQSVSRPGAFEVDAPVRGLKRSFVDEIVDREYARMPAALVDGDGSMTPWG